MIRRLITFAATIILIAAQSALAQKEANQVWDIEFKKGDHGKTISSSIKGDDDVDYNVKTSDGQVLHILFFVKSGSCYMNVFEPRRLEEAVFIGSTSGNEFGASPTKAGVYKIQVYQMRASARRNETCKYSISFELTGGKLGAGI